MEGEDYDRRTDFMTNMQLTELRFYGPVNPFGLCQASQFT